MIRSIYTKEPIVSVNIYNNCMCWLVPLDKVIYIYILYIVIYKIVQIYVLSLSGVS